MLLGIDHIVIACADPDAAADEIGRRVGLEPGGGGRHPRFGTFNRLVWLGDSYLELMGVDDPDLARGRGIGAATVALLEAGQQGFASFAVASDDLAGDVARLRSGGAPYEDPKPGERRRPDGEVVRWMTALPDRVGRDGLPFLIEHAYAGAEWGAGARLARRRARQPLGGHVEIVGLELAVADPAAAAKRYRAGLGLAIRQGSGGAVRVAIGSQGIVFVPDSGDVPPSAIVIAATGGEPRSLDVLGCRFVVEVTRAS